MKKIIAILLTLIIVLTFSACKGKETTANSGTKSESDISSLTTTSSEDAPVQSENTTTEASDTSSDVSSNSSSAEEAKTSSVSSSASSEKPVSSDSSETISKPSSSNQNTTSSDQSTSSDNTENQEPAPDDEQINLDDLVLGEDYDFFTHNGFYIGNAVVDDILYIGFRRANQVIAYDTKNLEVVNVYTLLPAKDGQAFEMRFLNNNFYISYPKLNCIKVYDKNTFEEIKTISLPYEVASFCIDGDIVYYCDDFDHSYVYKTNTATGETIQTRAEFSEAKLELNKEKGLLYIGESLSTGSKLYYYRTSDLTGVSSYIYGYNGLSNNRRSLFFDGENVFWRGKLFDSQSAKTPIKEYSGNASCHIDENYAITDTGVYSRATDELLLELEDIYYAITTPDETLILIYGDENAYEEGSMVIIIPIADKT